MVARNVRQELLVLAQKFEQAEDHLAWLQKQILQRLKQLGYDYGDKVQVGNLLVEVGQTTVYIQRAQEVIR